MKTLLTLPYLVNTRLHQCSTFHQLQNFLITCAFSASSWRPSFLLSSSNPYWSTYPSIPHGFFGSPSFYKSFLFWCAIVVCLVVDPLGVRNHSFCRKIKELQELLYPTLVRNNNKINATQLNDLINHKSSWLITSCVILTSNE